MITPTTLYKEMSKWVDPKDRFPVINFTGEEAVAVTSFSLAIVKNWPTPDPHLENPDGIRTKEDLKFPDYRKVCIAENNVGWRQEFRGGKPFLSHPILSHWKLTFQFVERMLKRPKEKYFPVHLQKRSKKLLLYAVNENICLKLVLADELEDDADWESTYNVKYLLKSVEFLLAAGTEEFRMYVNKNEDGKRFLAFESAELMLLFVPLLLTSVRSERVNKLLRFVTEERRSPHEEQIVIHRQNDDEFLE